MRHTICAALVLLWASTAPAGPITISEVLYDAPGPDNGATFVELYGPAGGSLAGFVLEGINGSGGGVTHQVLLDALVFPPDGFLVLADEASGGGTLVGDWDVLIPNLDLQNGPDSVRLRFGAEVVDALGYGAFGGGFVFAGEGVAALAALPGESLSRPFANVDTDINRADFIRLSEPTPGRGSIHSTVPEPAALLMLGGGLLALLGFSRRRGKTR